MRKHFQSKIGFLTVFGLLFSIQSFSQEPKAYKVACVGFYNLENLFDIYDDPDKNDKDFLPNGSYAWDSTKYNNKLVNMSTIISELGTSVNPDGVGVLGVCEVENRTVLEDLVEMPAIKDRDYKIVHYDSPDERGIDVGLLYQEKYFNLKNSSSYTLIFDDNPDDRTRDQLVVSGEMDGEAVSIIVSHWPSRSGGQSASAPKRNQAAQLGRRIIDSLLNIDPNAKIILMGDLNDDPNNESVEDYIRAKGKIKKMADGDLFNTMYDHFKSGNGSLAYRDSWNLFDQIIISKALTSLDASSYVFHIAVVYNKDHLKQKSGRYKGYPLRTHAGGEYLNGYSDHFPVFIVLKKEVN